MTTDSSAALARATWSPRLDHVALTVPDLDEGIAFFRDNFAASELYRLGPFDSSEIPPAPDGRDWSATHVNVPHARFSIAMMAFPDGPYLELFDYELPEGAQSTPPRNNDVGGHHLAFKVPDIEAAAQYVRDLGLTLMDGPLSLEDGPAAGTRVHYFLSPWGLQLEMIEYDDTTPWLTEIQANGEE